MHETKDPPWRAYLTEQDLAVINAYRQVAYLKRRQPGIRPALLVVDANYYFLGPEPQSIVDSIADWPLGCGRSGWEALPAIERLLQTARQKQLPILYTTGDSDDPAAQRGPRSRGLRGSDIPPEIAPAAGELVLFKSKPSAFFATPLLSHLIPKRVDTVVLAGCTTSGCVRATAVDAASYGLHVVVVEEAVFDRIEASHAVSLFDMESKYAQVIQLTEALDYLSDPVAVTSGV